MTWKGVIIEESLEDRCILDLVKIVDTAESTLESEENRGVLHFHKIEVDNDKKDNFVEKAVPSIKQGAWYIHVCKGGVMTMIFRGKYFSFNKHEKDNISAAKNYGMSIGILKEQMDIENLIDNPWD